MNNALLQLRRAWERYGYDSAVLADLAAQWQLEFDGPAFSGASSVLCYVRSRGRPAVLKAPAPGSAEERTAEYLCAWRGRGVVELLEHSGSVALLARLDPGTPLSAGWSPSTDAEALRIVAGQAERLFDADVPAPNAPTALEWGASLLARPRPDIVPSDTWAAATERYATLAGEQGAVALVHGDLHHDNILNDDRLGWVAIDPKGVTAEREFELACALRNPIDQAERIADPALVRNRLALLAGDFDLDRERLAGWACAQAVLAAAWAVEDGQPAAPWLLVARAYRDRP